MKKAVAIYAGLVCFVMAGVILAVSAGCDTAPSEQMNVTISPQTAELKTNEFVELVASGAVTYEWSIKYDSPADTNQIWGLLSSDVGDRVLYENVRTPTNLTNFIQIITVTGRAGHETNSSTATITDTAKAYITHRW